MGAFLSHDWAGLATALVIGFVGFVLFKSGRRVKRRFLKWPLYGIGGLVLIIAIILTVSSGIHVIKVARLASKYPPPGELVDVGGYNMHILAEGKNNGYPTLIWVPGGHAAGYNFYNFHKVFREETRSILFDRPGTGWSDTGPFPRTTSREIDELHRLLAASGETGPHILIGHSYGGLLAGSYASRYPEQVAGLILLEAGPVETWENNEESLKFMNLYRKQILIGAWAMTFGLAYKPQKGNPEVERLMDIYENELKDVWPELMATGRFAKNGHTSASIFDEVNTKEFYEDCRLKPGALNGKPVYGFYYLGGEDLSSQKARDFIRDITKLDEEGIDKQITGLRRTRRIHRSLSDRYESFSLPEGTGHNFPYERPDFVIDHVRRMLRMTARSE